MSVSGRSHTFGAKDQMVLGEGVHVGFPKWAKLTLEFIGVILVFLVPTFWVFGIPLFLLAKFFGD